MRMKYKNFHENFKIGSIDQLVKAIDDLGFIQFFVNEIKGFSLEEHVAVNCCHPGAVTTNIGIDRDTGFGKTITGLLKPFFQTPMEGARTAIFLASDKSVENITGGYFYKCKIAKSSKRSKSKKLAKKLFELSEKLVSDEP